MDEIIDPGYLPRYPLREYPTAAKGNAGGNPQVRGEEFKALRFADETLYLRSEFSNIMNGMIGLTTSPATVRITCRCGSFTAQGLSFWLSPRQ